VAAAGPAGGGAATPLAVVRLGRARATAAPARPSGPPGAAGVGGKSRRMWLRFDDRARLIDVNRAAARFFGLRRADLLGRDWNALCGGSAALPTPLLGSGTAARRGPALVAIGRTARGERPVRLRVRRVEGPAGAPTLLVRMDVLSHARAWDQRLFESQKMEALGRLAGGIAHDFNNLLTAIQGNAQLLLLDLPPDHPAREEVEAIAQAAARGASLTQQLLAFGRRQALRPQPVDVNALLRQIHVMLHRVLGAGWTFLLELAPDLPPIEADPGQLEQALLNLVTNARDAMPQGGRIVARTAPGTWDPGDFSPGPDLPPGRYVVVEIADEGTGIDAALLPQIFEPFVSTKQTRGTGLGLAMVYGVVRQSRGGIAVRTARGRGSSFRLFFPPAEGPVAALSRPREAAVPTRRGRVLVVEDEPAVRELAVRVLERAGYEVHAEGTATAALAWAAGESALDAAVVDVSLPELDGRTLADRLRARFPAARLVLISGSGEIEEPPEGIGWLAKPFATQALLAALEERPTG